MRGTPYPRRFCSGRLRDFRFVAVRDHCLPRKQGCTKDGLTATSTTRRTRESAPRGWRTATTPDRYHGCRVKQQNERLSCHSCGKQQRQRGVGSKGGTSTRAYFGDRDYHRLRHRCNLLLRCRILSLATGMRFLPPLRLRACVLSCKPVLLQSRASFFIALKKY